MRDEAIDEALVAGLPEEQRKRLYKRLRSLADALAASDVARYEQLRALRQWQDRAELAERELRKFRPEDIDALEAGAGVLGNSHTDYGRMLLALADQINTILITWPRIS